jgi:hypothetical protein
MHYHSLSGLCGYGPYNSIEEALSGIGEYDGDDENGSSGDLTGWVIFKGVEVGDDPMSCGVVFEAKSIAKII